MTTETKTDKASNLPQYHAYHVTEKPTGNRWARIGAYFLHEDGKGGTLVLESLPILFDGRIVLRLPKAAPAEDAPAE